MKGAPVFFYFLLLTVISFVTGSVTNTNATLTTEATISDGLALKHLEGTTPVAAVGEARDFGISLLVIGGIALAVVVPILLFLVVLFFLPIPTLYFPASRLPQTMNGVLVAGKLLKSSGVLDGLARSESMQSFRGILESDSCVQRISCEVMRASKNVNLEKWVYGLMNDMPVNHGLKWKITRAAQASKNCKRFQCDPLSSMLKIFF